MRKLPIHVTTVIVKWLKATKKITEQIFIPRSSKTEDGSQKTEVQTPFPSDGVGDRN